MATEFITVYAKTTGQKQRVPKHYMDVPSIAKQFTKTPRQKTKTPRQKTKTPRQKKADEQQGTRRAGPVATTPDERANAAVAPETPAAGDNKE